MTGWIFSKAAACRRVSVLMDLHGKGDNEFVHLIRHPFAFGSPSRRFVLGIEIVIAEFVERPL